ncbi:DUF6776 family protein [Kineobactrum salinum]|uniref:Transmembrane protein n=1 Tax=Kineobactrum salinum TaxID=2708301 RepID=A0A6C0U1K8_9GAMM|nr:DUF6776 family protein [Kineobactrum salinum]QIB66012.1 hypothetical protein G3T16_11870 [Kineobactrum salinum]
MDNDLNRAANGRTYSRHRHRQIAVVVATLVAALMLGLGFFLGRAAAFSGAGVDPVQYRQQTTELAGAREQLAARERELAMLDTRHQVDRASLELVRRELAAQKEQIAGLEEGVRFYRSLMAPGEIAQGFSLRALELVARDEPRRFGFRIVAQQEARKHTPMSGELYAEVHGQLDGESHSFPLALLSDDLEDAVQPLRFRYFQSIEGELVLPAGFEPQFVSVAATISSPARSRRGSNMPGRYSRSSPRSGSDRRNRATGAKGAGECLASMVVSATKVD